MGTPCWCLESSFKDWIPHKIQEPGAPGSGGLEGISAYEAFPEYDSWTNVPIVNLNRNDGKVKLNANDQSNDNSGYSVPASRDCLQI